jgi:hypothetical protein
LAWISENLLGIEIHGKEKREFESVGAGWGLKEPIEEVNGVRGLLSELLENGIINELCNRFNCYRF